MPNGVGGHWVDMLYPYVKNEHVYDCPSHKYKMSRAAGTFYLGDSSYGFVSSTPSSTTFGVAGRHESVFDDPSNVIMLVDDGKCDRSTDHISCGRVIPTSGDTLATLLSRVDGVRHSGTKEQAGQAMNAAYCDGHAKYVTVAKTFPDQWQPK